MNSTLTNMIQFEEDYIFRSCRSITNSPDIALTELVANTWDAGAINVSIIIPEEQGGIISIEDDGIGMSDIEFNERWMTLNYNRQKHQGNTVEFPEGFKGYQRIAYGRNGIGRHGMLCFANKYTVETWKDGICNKYDISVSSGQTPFVINNHTSYEKDGHGTKLYTYIEKLVPKLDEMVDIISARFLYDPQFNVIINGKTIQLSQHKGIFEEKVITLKNGTTLKVTVIDSTKTARKSHQHGIAFWVGGRLVGKPSWTYDNFQFLDGRLKVAKRYTFVVQTDNLIDEVLPDWTGFLNNSFNMRKVYIQLKKYVDEIIKRIMSDQIRDVQLAIIEGSREQLEELPRLGKREVSAFIEEITIKHPVASQDFLKSAVEAVINIEKARKGEILLSQLSKMSAEDIDKLTDILQNWNINDVLVVLDEIDRRIMVIEAITRLCNDRKTDELHTLHPLILNARWLFGTQFDSPMFVSNVSLNTVIETLFKKEDYDKDYLKNPRRRPDIVVLKEYSLKAVCTDKFDDESQVMKPDQILIIELKRGGFEINENEVQQAMHYTRQIRKSGVPYKNASIHTYVVGSKIGDVDIHIQNENGIIDVVTYGHLVETASQKLFRLRDQLEEHYNSIGQDSIVEQALKQTQLKMKGISNE